MNKATIATAMATLRYTTHIAQPLPPVDCTDPTLCGPGPRHPVLPTCMNGVTCITGLTRLTRPNHLTHPTTPLPARPLARFLAILAIAAGAASLAGCPSIPPPVAPPRPAPPPQPVPLSQVPGARADPLDGLADAIARQCALARPPGDWPQRCAEFAAEGGQPRQWLERRFLAQELVDPARPEGLVTGYYEPLIRGSLTRESTRQVPIRGRPSDLLTIDLAAVEPKLQGLRLRGRVEGQRVVPYFNREALATRALPADEILGWADDPVDLFFVEIQGSGRVALRDGRQLRIGYADQNGHPYRAIGKTLIDRGALQSAEVTAPAIKKWLRGNPAQAPSVMNTNPSQVFFRVLPGEPDPGAGPPGAMAVPLTPLRSVAVDRRQIPLGTLLFVSTTDPLTGQPIERFMVAQDTGGAIVGGKRLDLFWGAGPRAEEAAGLMKAPARIWRLVPMEGPVSATSEGALAAP